MSGVCERECWHFIYIVSVICEILQTVVCRNKFQSAWALKLWIIFNVVVLLSIGLRHTIEYFRCSSTEIFSDAKLRITKCLICLYKSPDKSLC